MSAEDYLFTHSGNLTDLIRTTTVDNNHLPSAATSQSSRDQKPPPPVTADERRLLRGNYVSNGEQAVPIKPAPRKVPDYSIRPTNTLLSNRQSNRHAAIQTPFVSIPKPRASPAYTDRCKRGLEQASDVEEGRSLQKRSRTEKSQPSPHVVIEIEDSDDHSHVGTRQSALRCLYAQKFGNDPAPAPYQGGGVPEFREVDATVAPRAQNTHKKSRNKDTDSSFDEQFMYNAKRERQKKMAEPTRKPKGPCSPAVLKGVEIPGPNIERKEDTRGKGGQPAQDKDAARRRSSSALESPDELQGEATIRKPDLRSSRSPIVPPSDASPKRGNMPPSHILPVTFTKLQRETRRKSSRKSSRASEKGAEREFNLKVARFQNQRYDETTHPDGGVLTIGDSDIIVRPKNREADREKHDVAIQNISTLFIGTDPSCKVRLNLRKTADASGDHLDLEFTSEKEKCDFTLVFLHHGKAAGVKDFERESGWMDNAFKKSENETASLQVTGLKRPSPGNKSDRKQTGAISTKPETRKRVKLNESLQEEGGMTKGNTDELDGKPLRHQRDTPDADGHGGGVKTRRNAGSDIPGRLRLQDSSISPFFESPETRSKVRKQAVTTMSGDEKHASPTRVNVPIPKWSKPLVYPLVGKRKAEVEAHDLERLRDHEFLNDNLVGLYLRFLEHHLELAKPDLAKRIYVFNSYFFASLTNTPRGAKGINYHAVSKWTRHVDIFSRDFVVVPINENAHWYVAIICNLPELPRQYESEGIEPPASEKEKIGTPSVDSGGDLSKIPKSEPNTEPNDLDKKEAFSKETTPSDGDEQHTRKDLASLTLSDQKEEAPLVKDAGSEKEDWPEVDENPPSPATKVCSKSKPEEKEDKAKPPENSPPSSPPAVKATSTESRKPPRKSAGRPKRKYDEKQPIIITFDSLGCPRYPTINILREYLVEEGNAKRSMKIEKGDIMGMTAKGIPEQGNYSDCGLYLLAYLEKFTQDPDGFIWKLLKKEMKEKDWPKMESRVLRKHLREFLVNLHDEQEGRSQKTNSEMSSMFDAQPLEILLKPREKAAKEIPGDSTITSSTRGSPGAPEVDQRKTSQHTVASPGPGHVTDALFQQLSAHGRKAEDSASEEIPCTPSEASQPIDSADAHGATEPQVPGTPDAQISGKDGRSETLSRHSKIVEGTPSPQRKSPRHSRKQDKQLPLESEKIINEPKPEQPENHDFMDRYFTYI